MPTLRQAVERQREAARLPLQGPITGRALNGQFSAQGGGSVRRLLAAMDVSQDKPWAVILCRFQGAAADPAVEAPIEALYRGMFAPVLGSVVEYWRDASLGAVRVGASQVFGWLTVAIPRSQAGGSSLTSPPGPGRAGLTDLAIAALADTGEDTTRFAGYIAVYTENWSEPGHTQKGDWASWAPFWIDGSASGKKVTMTPTHAGDIVVHEMGHGFGMQHDRSPDLSVDYADPCCTMSQRPLFFEPRFGVNFGPGICVTHLLLQGWMYRHRTFTDPGQWMNLSEGISLPLAATNDPAARANLAIVLRNQRAAPAYDYHLEYARPIGWNRALAGDQVFVRRVAPDESSIATAIILGSIMVPADPAQTSSFVEPAGNVLFEARRFDPDGRRVRVTATLLS